MTDYKQIFHSIRQASQYPLRLIAHYTNGVGCKPKVIIFDYTNRCNFKCKTCDIWKIKEHNELSVEEWKGVILQLREWLGRYTATFSGGEPFLKPGLLELMRYATSMGVRCQLNTNGSLINEKVAKELVESGIIEGVGISLYSLDADVNNNIRGIAVFDIVKSALDRLIEWNNKLSKNVSIHLCVLMVDRNLEEVPSLISWAKEMGIVIILQPLIENFTASHNPDWFKGDTMLPRVSMKKKGYPILNDMKQLKAFWNYYLNPTSILSYRCLAGVNNLTIHPGGQVSFCFNSNKIGNVRESKISDIWNNHKAVSTRKKMWGCRQLCRINNCYFERSFIFHAKGFARQFYG